MGADHSDSLQDRPPWRILPLQAIRGNLRIGHAGSPIRVADYLTVVASGLIVRASVLSRQLPSPNNLK